MQPFGADGKTDPDQRDVKEEEDYYRQGGELEPLFAHHDQSKQQKQDDDRHRDDHCHPIALPVKAAPEREQQLLH